METLRCWTSPHGYFILMFLTSISKGSTCQAPSSPQCFRQSVQETIYICEWDFDTDESDVTFELYTNDSTVIERKCENVKEKYCTIPEECLIVGIDVELWVEANTGDSSCTSPRRTSTLKNTVKYKEPQDISLLWLKNSLKLRWPAAEDNPAVADVWFRQNEHPTETWEKRLENTTYGALMHEVVIENLLKTSAYQFKIRHQSTTAKNPLWSNWSPVITVPAGLEHKPEVTSTVRLENGTRRVELTWKPMSHAATITGVNYSINDTQRFHKCPCMKQRQVSNTKNSVIYVSLSAVNITIIAKNAAGQSLPAIIQEPAAIPTDLKICSETRPHMKKLRKRTCLELYELKNEDLIPEKIIILKQNKKQEKRPKEKQLEDYIRYLYFEHRCDGGKPQTVKMCLFYAKEGVPQTKPKDFMASDETQNSAKLSWKPILYEDQQGFHTHYNLCMVKISSENDIKECFNISSSATSYQMENLTPGSKYNISLAGATRVGEGPVASVVISTWPEKPTNVGLSLGLMLIFFLLSIMFTVICKRIKAKILPPVPAPVIPVFDIKKQDSEVIWERKEEVHDLTLHQLFPEQRYISEETTLLQGESDGGTNMEKEKYSSDSEGSNEECVSPDSNQAQEEEEMTAIEQVDTVLAMLTYRNGLVFDMKTQHENM
ncbi:uncharacterized protein il12rb1 [Menidia menidia]